MTERWAKHWDPKRAKLHRENPWLSVPPYPELPMTWVERLVLRFVIWSHNRRNR